MIYGSETWAVNAEQEAKLERAEMRMVRWMCGVSLREKKTNAELRESMGIEKISDIMRRSRLRWMGHVLRKEGNDWVKKSMEVVVVLVWHSPLTTTALLAITWCQKFWYCINWSHPM